MPEMPDDGRVSFESVVIADIDITASSNNLRLVAVNHIKRRGGGILRAVP